jgi:hypothetical protein
LLWDEFDLDFDPTTPGQGIEQSTLQKISIYHHHTQHKTSVIVRKRIMVKDCC